MKIVGFTALDYARQQLAMNVKESGGENAGIPAERYSDGEAKAWCASFLRWCFERAGIPLPGKRHMIPAVHYMERMLREAGAGVTAPEVGCIVTFSRRMDSDASPRGHHCGIVDHVTFAPDAGGRLAIPTGIGTIEGNIADEIGRRNYKLGDKRIRGFFRWPVKRDCKDVA